MCSCDAVRPEAYVEVRRTARKSHQCDECLGVIVVGEVYRYASGIWDGCPADFKLCLFCDALYKVAHKVPPRLEWTRDRGYIAPTEDQELAEALCCAAIGEAEACLREVVPAQDALLAQIFGRTV